MKRISGGLRRNRNHPGGRQERGVVAIIVALSLVVLVGFAGLALDLGKLYVAKSELQNSADACALALFTIIGVRKGVALEFSAPVAVLLGVVTGVAGGILRDVLIGNVPLVFQPEIHLYATAALCGAIVYVALHDLGAREPWTTITGAVLVLALRLAGIRWRISLPIFEPK